MDEPLDFRPTWGAVRRHWRLFGAVAAVAILLSAVLSGPRFIKPRYRSQAVVYPVNISTYSIETQSDQLMQLLESNSIRDSLAARFDLVKHYGIDTAAPGWRSLLRYLFSERVVIEKTRYESVDIRVTDEDPVLARDMAMAVLHQTDRLARRLQRHNSAELLDVIHQDVRRTKQRMDSVEARMDELRQTQGLLDYGAQAKELTKGYMHALTTHAGQPQKAEIQARLKALEDHGGEFDRLARLNADLVADYSKRLSQERQVQLDLAKELTYTNVVVQPEVSDKKVYPVRWLLVLVSTVAALLLCYVLVFLRDKNASAPSRAGRA